MLKNLTVAILGPALVCGVAAPASAKTLTTPSPPNIRFTPYPARRTAIPPIASAKAAPFTGWRLPALSTAERTERGYPTGDPQNPRTGG